MLLSTRDRCIPRAPVISRAALPASKGGGTARVALGWGTKDSEAMNDHLDKIYRFYISGRPPVLKLPEPLVSGPAQARARPRLYVLDPKLRAQFHPAASQKSLNDNAYSGVPLPTSGCPWAGFVLLPPEDIKRVVDDAVQLLVNDRKAFDALPATVR